MPIQSCGQSVSARRGKRCTEIGLLTSYDVASTIHQTLPILAHRRVRPERQSVVDAAPVRRVIENKHSTEIGP